MIALKRASIVLGMVMLILSIPFLFMQFSKEVVWSPTDLLVAGCLLALVGFAIDFVLRAVKDSRWKVFIVVGIIAAFLLVWAELAVGVFGSPFAGNSAFKPYLSRALLPYLSTRLTSLATVAAPHSSSRSFSRLKGSFA